MPRRPFSQEPELTLWREMTALREGQGLTVEGVRRIAQVFSGVNGVRTSWEGEPLRRAEIVFEFLADWIDNVEGEDGYLLRIAYNREDTIPSANRGNTRSRRAFAAGVTHLSPDSVRSREGNVIAQFIRKLVQDVDGSPHQASHGSIPMVELRHHGQPWQRIDVPHLDQPTALSRLIQLERVAIEWKFNAKHTLVEHTTETELVAGEPDIRRTGAFLFWPEVDLARVRLEMLCESKFDRIGWIGSHLMVDVALDPPMAEGESRVVTYRALLEGEGEGPTTFEYGHQMPVGDVGIRISFDPDALPRRAWWFKDLPFGTTPGIAAAQRLLWPTPEEPFIERHFGPLRAEPFASGLSWEW